MRAGNTPHGTGRAKRREDMAAFHRLQSKLRDTAPEHRLPGDAPGMPLPTYYLNYLKRETNGPRTA